MIYRRFGRTQLQMPVFSCGGMRYQQKWQDIPLNEVTAENQQNLQATIRRSIALGINHIETARGYGSSERQLGQILSEMPRESLIVQTKIGPEKDPATFIKNFEESLKRLQLDHVDLLAIHGINNPETLEWSIRPGGCLEAARKLQAQGLARHIGFSTHAATSAILDAIKAPGPDGRGFDYVNLHWYYIFQRNWPAVEEATRRDMGVFIISPSDKGGMLYQPSEKLMALCQPLHPLIFNDLFCLARQEVHTLSIGAARPTDFDLHVESLQYMDRLGQILPAIIQRLDNAVRETMGAELSRPFEMDLPEWEQTPGEINVPIILWLRNLAMAYDMIEYGKMRYSLLGNGGHWFPGKNAANVRELDLAPIAQHSKLGDGLVPMLEETHRLLWKEPVKRLSQS
jgi:predicted aldo/keto reductase-like oxidoreductase